MRIVEELNYEQVHYIAALLVFVFAHLVNKIWTTGIIVHFLQICELSGKRERSFVSAVLVTGNTYIRA